MNKTKEPVSHYRLNLFTHKTLNMLKVNITKPDKDKEKKSSAQEVKISVNAIEQAELYLTRNYKFRYNEVSNEVEYCQNDETEYETADEASIWRALQKQGIKIQPGTLGTLLSSDFVRKYDPFNQYFKRLKDPGNFDYIDYLSGFIKSKEHDRFAYHLKKHLVRAVACALEPTYFNKHAFILVGYKQNTGKSTWCRFLCPPALENYLAENPSSDKDGLITLSENFIINLDELAQLGKQDINKLKTMFSKDRVKVRHPFGRKAVTTPRRASFVGSINDQEFLTDDTGSVRWLCFEIDEIDFNYSVKVDIDKVWAQAYREYKKGFKYQLTREDIIENEKANAKFQKSTPEKEMIAKYFEPGNTDDEFFNATEIIQELTIQTNSIIKFNHIQIGKACNQLGFQRASKRSPDNPNANPQYGYYIKRKY